MGEREADAVVVVAPRRRGRVLDGQLPLSGLLCRYVHTVDTNTSMPSLTVVNSSLCAKGLPSGSVRGPPGIPNSSWTIVVPKGLQQARNTAQVNDRAMVKRHQGTPPAEVQHTTSLQSSPSTHMQRSSTAQAPSQAQHSVDFN